MNPAPGAKNSLTSTEKDIPVLFGWNVPPRISSQPNWWNLRSVNFKYEKGYP